MTGLVYEVIWTRLFTNVFGNTTYAVSVVLAAFMGGLAMGSFVLGRFIDRRGRHLEVYALLELGIGLSALALPPLLDVFTKLYAFLFQHLGPSTWLLTLVKTVVSFMGLLIPTFLMGGTLPVLCKFFIKRTERSGSAVGLLYGMNTFGATIGCFLTGFIFIEAFGLSTTIVFTAITNLALALLFFLLGTITPSGEGTVVASPVTRVTSPFSITQKHATLLLIVSALAGFIALSFEVLWTRLLVFKLHTTIYAFTIMLTTFLAGIGLGSLLFSILNRYGVIKNHFSAFGVIEALIGLLGLGSIALFGIVESLADLWEAISWKEQILNQQFLAALIMLVPTILMGMALPLIVQVYILHIKRVGTGVGTVYATNTLGAILGSLLTGFALVLALGTQKCIVLISLIALVMGSVMVLYRPDGSSELRVPPWLKALAVSSFWVIAVTLIVLIPSDHLFRYYNIGEKKVDSLVEILYAHEGVECITTVHRYPDGNRVISTGSINVAGTDYTLRTTQKLQAHIPMLLHPNPRDVLQVGFGSGETSHILTTYETEHVDVVEISKGVHRTAARYFEDLNQGVVDHPKFRSIIMDGANYVALTDRRYDLILNDSIWPFYSGNSGLYTKEYFDACRHHLKTGGIMTSWLPLEMPEASFKSVLKTFHSVFPHVSLWLAVTHFNKHALLVGSTEPLKIDIGTFFQRFDRFAMQNLRIVNLDDPALFLDAYKMNESDIAPWVEDASIHTLDHPVLEFAPRKKNPGKDQLRSYELIARSRSSVTSLFSRLDSIRVNHPEFISDLVNARGATRRVMTGLVMREKGEGNFVTQFEQALRQKHNHPGARYLLDELERIRKIDLSHLDRRNFNDLINLGKTLMNGQVYDKALVVFTRARMIRPGSAVVAYNLGNIYHRQGRLDLALEELNSAIAIRPGYVPSFNSRGLINFSLGRHVRAIDDFTQAIRLDPGYDFAYSNRGIVYATTGEFSKALEDFHRAIDITPDRAQAYFNRGLVYQSGFSQLGIAENLGYEKAIREYSIALQYDPRYAKAYNNRGMLYAMQEQYQRAISDFDRAIELSPDQADLYFNRGLAYRLWGREEQARKDIEKAIRLDPTYQGRG